VRRVDIDAGVIDGVIISKLDRLTRSLADWAFLINEYFCEKKGKKLIGVDNQINTMSANGRKNTTLPALSCRIDINVTPAFFTSSGNILNPSP
jgi:DNA invertase Pin-like site-specific DNA recombinase